MRITRGTLSWPPVMCRSVAALFMIWSRAKQAEVHGHDLDDGAHAGHRGSDPGAHERRLRERRVADPVGAELVQKPFADAEAAAVPADVLSHEEHPVVLSHGLADRLPHGLPVRQVSGGDGHRSTSE